MKSSQTVCSVTTAASNWQMHQSQESAAEGGSVDGGRRVGGATEEPAAMVSQHQCCE